MTAPVLQPHPAANLFPMMSDEEIDDLARDIKDHGQKRPIVLFEGKILDGRNRYEACTRAGLAPTVEQWNAIDPRTQQPRSATQWVLSENLHRRHLTVDQRALIALEARPLLAAEAKARQRAAGGDRRAKRDANPPWAKHTEALRKEAASRGYDEMVSAMSSGDPDVRHEVFNRAWVRWGEEVAPGEERLPPQGGKRSLTSAAEAAQSAGVSARSVERALRVQQAKPELLQQVRDGKLTLKQAEKKVAKGERLREVLAYTPPKGRFAVIATDVPWKYDDELDGSDLVRGGLDYPTMTIEEIIAMNVGETLAAPDCVLWFWVTNAFLLDGSAARVVREWGFTAKALLTWRKDRIGNGRYLRAQTEHVILAIRGRPLINGESVANIFDAPRRAHSEKPDEAYALFEKVSPAADGARLDLFACKKRKGWVSSGAEVGSEAEGAKASKRQGKGRGQARRRR